MSAPTPSQGTPITLSGTQYFLRFTWRTRKQLIELFGGEEKLREGLSGDNLAQVLLAGLKHGEQCQQLTVEQLEEMIDLRDVIDIARSLAKAMGYKEGTAKILDEGGPENPTPAAAASAS